MNSFALIHAIELTDYFNAGVALNAYTTRPRIVCADGYSLSAQASSYSYCTPRVTNLKSGIYTAVEVGYVQDPNNDIIVVEEWSEYNSDGEIYGYLPIELVIRFITDHGGWDKNKINTPR